MRDGDLTLKDAARELGITRDTLRAWIAKLGIEPRKFGGYKVLDAGQIAKLCEAPIRRTRVQR